MKLRLIFPAALLAGCAATQQPARPDAPPPIVEPEPTAGSLVVTLADYAECFVERTAEAMQGRLIFGPCP